MNSTTSRKSMPRFRRALYRLVEPSEVLESPDERRQARLLSRLVLGLIVLGVLAEATYRLLVPEAGRDLETLPVLALLFLAYLLSRTPRYRLAAGLSIVVSGAAIYFLGISTPSSIEEGLFDFFFVPIILASAFLTPLQVAGLLTFSLASMAATPLLAPSISLTKVLIGPITFNFVSGVLLLLMTLHRNLLERDRQAELAEKESRYRTLVEQIPAITYLDEVDPSSPTGFRSLYVSPQFERWLGYSIEEYQRDPTLWASFIHPDDRSGVIARDAAYYVGSGESVQEYRLVSRNEDVLWVRDHARIRQDPSTQRQLSQGILLDITEARQAEARIREEAARAEALLRVARRLNAQLELDALLRTLSEETARALNVPLASVYLHDERRAELVPAAGTRPQGRTASAVPPVPRRFFDRAFEEQGPVVVISDLAELTSLPGHEAYVALNVRTIAFARMEYEGELIGTLNAVTQGEQRVFGHEERMLLQGLADQAALAIVNTRLFHDAQRRLERLQALRAIDIAITTNQDLQLTLEVLLGQITRQLGVDAAAILVEDERSGSLQFAAGHGFRTQALRYTRLGPGEGFAGQAALQRKIISNLDLEGDPGAFTHAPHLRSEGFVSYFAAPLTAKDRLMGVLEVFHRSSLDPDPEWKSFLESLAGQAAIAIDNTSLFDDLQRSNAELTQAYDATIEGWSRALDLRDKETEGHTQRVTETTLRLATAMGLGQVELMHIRRGALLHDIGKMGIPDHILLKPGPLTEEEWVLMRQHPVYAHEMLSPIEFLRPALDIPYCHHEKWDGSGYPRGLEGEQIPLAARLFSVVDVWDALLSDRPYRPGWPEENVLEHIRAESGTHFDPQVVDLFLGLMSKEG